MGHKYVQTNDKKEIQEAGDKPNVVVATFETSALELLFPFPQLRGYNFQLRTQNISRLAGPYCPGVDVDLLMEPTRDFPGIIAPKVILINTATKTNTKINKKDKDTKTMIMTRTSLVLLFPSQPQVLQTLLMIPPFVPD